jgi:transposase-like protein
MVPFFRYKGTYQGAGRREVRRAQCKTCGRHFSEQSESETRRARRPELAAPVRRLLDSGLSIRAVARLLGVTRPTVRRRQRASP